MDTDKTTALPISEEVTHLRNFVKELSGQLQLVLKQLEGVQKSLTYLLEGSQHEFLGIAQRDPVKLIDYGALTQREKQVILRIGRGLTVKEIAKDLHLSHKTVETYRDRLVQKLNADGAHKLRYMAFQCVAALDEQEIAAGSANSVTPASPRKPAPDSEESDHAVSLG